MLSRPIYIPPGLDYVENVEGYRPGGFHPVSIGDVFADGRYRIIHKLGSGSFSTVWLARDRHLQNQNTSSVPGPLVALKVLSAMKSTKENDENAEVSIPQKLYDFCLTTNHPGGCHIQSIQDQFTVCGPNGTHQCMVYPLAGPSLYSLYDCPGRIAGSRRLRADLARKVALQCATAVELMHAAGIVHGDITTLNILLKVEDKIHEYTDENLYNVLGLPALDFVRTRDDSPCEPSAPQMLVAPFSGATLASNSLLQEDIAVVDFGQSFVENNPPKDYQAGTVIHFRPPETRFTPNINQPSDVWGLALTIFEIRAGFSLFEPFGGDDMDILRQTVLTLGKLPEPWWSSFENRDMWFEENGEPKPAGNQTVTKTSVREALRDIGSLDMPPRTPEGPMMEIAGTRLEEREIELLGDLLEKMLKYRPEDRITLEEVVKHPWFTYDA